MSAAIMGRPLPTAGGDEVATSSDGTRLIGDGEILDGRVLLSAQGHRRWRAERVEAGPLRAGFSPGETVYALHPQGGDTHGFGGVKRLVRSEHDLFAHGWRVVA